MVSFGVAIPLSVGVLAPFIVVLHWLRPGDVRTMPDASASRPRRKRGRRPGPKASEVSPLRRVVGVVDARVEDVVADAGVE